MKNTTRVHLLIDNNEDEMLTALYMQNVLKEAGIESKLCVGTDQLYWKDAIIIDNDGETVRLVWKLWTWDTIIQDYIDINKEHDVNNDHSTKHPRISDILLHEQINVIEPLWKVITSNKALLPVLCQMYPNHPNLLQSEWNLTNELKQIAFVKKPIVGRGGQNITLYNPGGDSVIAETTGNFSTRDSIYQELFPFENYNSYHPIIGSWIIRSNYAGFAVHEDQNLITNKNSPVTPCCIVWEEEK
jgi:glutathionylspermidine amidase/synthetase